MRAMVELAAKMYKCQKTARNFFGVEYPEKISKYIAIINAHAKEKGLDTLPAMMEVCQLPQFCDNGMAVLMFMAAAVEIVEPET